MNELLHEIKVAARQASRLYFAPFVGAAKEVMKEVRALRPPPACPAKGENEDGKARGPQR